MGKIKTLDPVILSPPCLLQDNHRVDDFDCGHSHMNAWLKKHAMQNQRANSAKTFVVCHENHVVGFYSLAVGSIEHDVASPRTKKGLARHPIPVMLLARLAVDVRYQKHNVGRGLLKDALLRTLQAAGYAGIRAVFVHAKDELARNFYSRFDFEPSPVDPLKMMLLIKDIQMSLDEL
ncbi:GNAT family N-acetyltransferase [Desulfatiferula olefinivorans]